MWEFRKYINGKSRNISLGSAYSISLQTAIEPANEIQYALAHGKAIEEFQRAKQKEALAPAPEAPKEPTFEEMADRAITARAELVQWRNSKTELKWRARLRKHAFPLIGARPVSSITRDDVLKILSPIWKQTPEIAKCVRIYL